MDDVVSSGWTLCCCVVPLSRPKGLSATAVEFGYVFWSLAPANNQFNASSFLDGGHTVYYGDVLVVISSDKGTQRVESSLILTQNKMIIVSQGTNRYDGLSSMFLVDGAIVGSGQVAGVIAEHPGFAGQPVRLIVCYSACGGVDSAAQNISNSLNTTTLGVTAPVGTGSSSSYLLLVQDGS